MLTNLGAPTVQQAYPGSCRPFKSLFDRRPDKRFSPPLSWLARQTRSRLGIFGICLVALGPPTPSPFPIVDVPPQSSLVSERAIV